MPPPISIVTTLSANDIFWPSAKYKALEILSASNLVFSEDLKDLSFKPIFIALLAILLNDFDNSCVYASG